MTNVTVLVTIYTNFSTMLRFCSLKVVSPHIYGLDWLASSSFEPDVVCSVSQHRCCSVCMSFVRLGHHNR